MNEQQCVVKNGLPVLEHTKKIGYTRKACHYFDKPTLNFDRCQTAYNKNGGVDLVNKPPVAKGSTFLGYNDWLSRRSKNLSKFLTFDSSTIPSSSSGSYFDSMISGLLKIDPVVVGKDKIMTRIKYSFGA